jgi:patatin-like phospholipase/acyl hydrolase
MPPFRIVSIDGGGIRGVFAATLLERLEEAVPGFLAKARLFAGTSTGGVLALGLAAGMSPRAIGSLYVEQGPRIFDDSWLDDLKDPGGLAGADYDSANLKTALLKLFGTQTLGELPRRVLVSTFDLDNQDRAASRRQWKPKFFHNFSGADSDAGEKLVDVAMRSAAAPTKFPSYQGYIDGGVVANNPSMAALAQALDRRNVRAERARLEDVRLLSLGTGTCLRYVTGETLDWGYAQWLKPLFEILLQGSVGVADYECRQLLGSHYHRLAPIFTKGHVIEDDDVGRVPELIGLAREVDLGAAIAWLERSW